MIAIQNGDKLGLIYNKKKLYFPDNTIIKKNWTINYFTVQSFFSGT